MVWHALCLYYFDSFSPALCSQYLPYIGFDIFVYYLTTIFGGKDDMILAFPSRMR